MNKKGQIFDLAYILPFLILMVVCFVFGLYIVNSFNTGVSDAYSDEAKDFISGTETVWNYADILYPVMLVMTIIAIIVTYLYIPTHPVLIFIEFVVLFFVILFGWVLQEVSISLFAVDELNATANNFPIMTTINSNLGLVTGVVGLIILLVLFMKRGERD